MSDYRGRMCVTDLSSKRQPLSPDRAGPQLQWPWRKFCWPKVHQTGNSEVFSDTNLMSRVVELATKMERRRGTAGRLVEVHCTPFLVIYLFAFSYRVDHSGEQWLTPSLRKCKLWWNNQFHSKTPTKKLNLFLSIRLLWTFVWHKHDKHEPEAVRRPADGDGVGGGAAVSRPRRQIQLVAANVQKRDDWLLLLGGGVEGKGSYFRQLQKYQEERIQNRLQVWRER